MTTKPTQAAVSRLSEEHPPDTQIYDSEAKGLRLVMGKPSISHKHVGRINDGTDRYVCVMISRTDEVSLRSARERSAELRLVLRRGDAPRAKFGRSFHRLLPRPIMQGLGEARELTRPLESPLIFPSTTAKSSHIEQMVRIKSFPYAPHQMRHTYRTYALEAGVDFQSVAMLMDHANTHVSFNYVTPAHLTGHLRECHEQICARLPTYRGTANVLCQDMKSAAFTF